MKFWYRSPRSNKINMAAVYLCPLCSPFGLSEFDHTKDINIYPSHITNIILGHETWLGTFCNNLCQFSWVMFWFFLAIFFYHWMEFVLDLGVERRKWGQDEQILKIWRKSYTNKWLKTKQDYYVWWLTFLSRLC